MNSILTTIHSTKLLKPSLLSLLLAFGGQQLLAENNKVDFMVDIKPILEVNCVTCHQETKDKGDLRIDTKELAFTSGENGPSIVPGKPEESSLYTTTTYDRDDDDVMPPVKHDDDYTLSKVQQDLLKQWIQEGAEWPEGVTLKAYKKLPRKIDFVKHVQPILEFNCVACHKEDKDKGDLRIDTKALAMAGGENGECIIPGKPEESSFYILTTLDADDEDIMPPKKGPLEVRDIYILRRWIEEGAEWPDDITLSPKKKVDPSSVNTIHPEELFKSLNKAKPEHKNYTLSISHTSQKLDMVAIPGGKFTMGNNDQKSESPAQEIEISPFFMAKYETIWELYEAWSMSYELNNRTQNKVAPSEKDKVADIVTRPTPPYMEMSFGMGREGYPAICMTQLAAKAFCLWLSAKTGDFYRLPTEAEWEYACRAGTTTKYHFGDSDSQLKEYAWYIDNSDFQYQQVGKKKPNPWGLYDMHGNVSEWVLDQYFENGYQYKNKKDPIAVPTTLYPRSARGGSWFDESPALRSSARVGSHPDWKIQDPQIPKSVWYHTDATFVGFRVVRPLELPKLEDLYKYWPSKKELDAIPDR